MRLVTKTAVGAAALAFAGLLFAQEALQVGSAAPDFTAKDHNGNTVSLKDFKGKKHVVLWFYPKADTPGCTREGCGFRDEIKKFEDAGAQILGVSKDKQEANKAFAVKFNFPYPLLCDTEAALYKLYGVKGRETFVINKEGILVHINRKVNPDPAKQNPVLLEILKKQN